MRQWWWLGSTQVHLYPGGRNGRLHKAPAAGGTLLSAERSAVLGAARTLQWAGVWFVHRWCRLASFWFSVRCIVPDSLRTWKWLLEISSISEMIVNVINRSEIWIFVFFLVNPFKNIRKTEQEMSPWGGCCVAQKFHAKPSNHDFWEGPGRWWAGGKITFLP